MERKPRTVWMVNALTGMGGRKGTLALSADSLVFRPAAAGAGQTAYQLGQVSGVKRVRGTPVLEVRLKAPAAIHLVGFYFVEPPSLEIPRNSSPFVRRRTMKRKAVTKLRLANADLKSEIDQWVEAIRTARQQA
jgi:hypothetical protein